MMSRIEGNIALNICSRFDCEPESLYAYLVRNIGAQYLLRECRETQSNRSVCIDEIKEEYGDKVPLNEPWCAQFGFVLHQAAVRHLHSRVVLPRTKGALDMLNRSKRVPIRVDQFPEAGAIAYRKTKVGTGHIMAVIAVQSNGRIWTIEGNTNNRVGLRYYDTSTYANGRNGWAFIHVQDYYRNFSNYTTRLEWY
ncbi:MAG: hypothetical protein JNL32_04795 [Candidatus Kapabacteria bacterium]|nr:hypothetical protein [Candidatus Kapabacteria bacterium]